jgi:glycosyltransferase involved in cell wall biosynthesis
VTRTIVVVPCYNEEKRLPVADFESFLESDAQIGFVFVNDGSRDATLERLESLERMAPDRVQILDLPQNGGKAEAVRRGLLAAFALGPEFAGYWDADLATPLGEIAAFRQLLEEKPDVLLVMGSRVRLLGREIERSALRHYTGRVAAMAISLMLRLPVYDTQCGAKLLRVTPETRALFAEPFRAGWLFDVELIARLLQARRRGGPAAASALIQEHPLREWRDAGGSKVGPWDYLRSALALFGIWRRHLRRGASPA